MDGRRRTEEEVTMKRLVQHAKQESTRMALVRAGAVEWTTTWLRRFGNDKRKGSKDAKRDALRLLRNLCVEKERAKWEMRRAGVAQVVCDALEPARVDLCKVVMQVLCNYTIEFQEGQEEVWNVWFPLAFQNVLEGCKDAHVAAMASRTILHCVEENCAWAEKLANSQSGRRLTAAIVQVTGENSFGGRESESLEELLKLLCLQHDFYTALFHMVECPSGKAQLTSAFSQCIANQREQMTFNLSSVELAELIRDTLDLAARACKQEQIKQTEPLWNREDLNGMSLLLYHMLGLLREVTQVEACREKQSMQTVDILDQLYDAGILKVLVEMLGSLGVPNPFRLQKGRSKEQIKHCYLSESTAVFPSYHLYFGYRTDIVAALANMCFRRSSCQDELLALGGVELVLSNCQVESASPLLREWSLVCIRNLCEQSEPIRQHIASLQLLDAERHPELEELGLRVEIGSNGKPAIRHFDALTQKPLKQHGWKAE